MLLKLDENFFLAQGYGSLILQHKPIPTIPYTPIEEARFRKTNEVEVRYFPFYGARIYYFDNMDYEIWLLDSGKVITTHKTVFGPDHWRRALLDSTVTFGFLTLIGRFIEEPTIPFSL